jgi:putative membrane protein
MTIIRYARRLGQPGTAAMAAKLFGTAAAFAAVLGGGTATAQTAIPPPTPDFATAATQSDAYEIRAAEDAMAQSQNPRVRAFARQMIDEHTRASEALRQAATASGLPPPPPAMSSDQAAMLSSLQANRGAAFDQAYARQQVLAHRQALAVTQSYATQGADATMRKAAQSAIPMIQHHLEMAEQMHSALGDS